MADSQDQVKNGEFGIQNRVFGICSVFGNWYRVFGNRVSKATVADKILSAKADQLCFSETMRTTYEYALSSPIRLRTKFG